MWLEPVQHMPVVLAAGSAGVAESINSAFTPINYIFFLILLLVGMVVYYQWKWSKTVRENVQVLVVKADGHGDYELAPQAGGSVTLKNPHNNSVRMWPINKLATIDVPYPGEGFVPRFMRKSIRQVIVDEEDWEPLLNRSPYKEKVASPDVVEFLQECAAEISADNPSLADRLINVADSLNPAPTREMIASPTVLGNLMHEKITEAVITVNKEMLDSITGAMSKIGKVVSPTIFYVCIGALALIGVVTLTRVMPMASKIDKLESDIAILKQAMGIPSENLPSNLVPDK